MCILVYAFLVFIYFETKKKVAQAGAEGGGQNLPMLGLPLLHDIILLNLVQLSMIYGIIYLSNLFLIYNLLLI